MRKQLEHNYVKHVEQCLHVQWKAEQREISAWASIENQLKAFSQAVGTKSQWTLEHVQKLTPRFFQIGVKNSETHYVQTFPPSTMSISMSNKCASKHVPNILWWWGWCLSLLADSLKGHEVQLAYVKHSLIVWLTMSSQFMPFH